MNSSRTVLVTGGSRGIGAAIVRQLAADGFSVVLNFRSGVAHAEALTEELATAGAKIRMLPFNVADRRETVRALEADLAEHGPYYGAVLCAGIARDGSFPGLQDEDWDEVLRTNLDGFFNVLHPLTMPMIRARAGGRIVALTSVSGLVGNRGQTNYSASKAGIIGAAKALAVELASRKITVNCVAPGLIDTDMIESAPLDKILPTIPAGRLGAPDEVAALVGFLMSDRAAYITRQVISINGGMFGRDEARCCDGDGRALPARKLVG